MPQTKKAPVPKNQGIRKMIKTVLQEPGGHRHAKNIEHKSSKNYTKIRKWQNFFTKMPSRESEEKIYVKILFF